MDILHFKDVLSHHSHGHHSHSHTASKYVFYTTSWVYI